jgi:hypothetical protein
MRVQGDSVPARLAIALAACGLTAAALGQQRGEVDPSVALTAPEAAPPAQGAVAGLTYQEDFEAGFVAGNIQGQNGWQGPLGQAIVTTTNPIGGMFSARHVSSGTGSPQNTQALRSPAFPGGTQFGKLAADVRLTANTTVYDFIPRDIAVAPPNQFFNTRVRFANDGSVLVAQADPQNLIFIFHDTGVDWVVGAVHRVCVEVVDSSGELNVYLDGKLIFTGLDTQKIINNVSHGIGDYLTFSNNVGAGSPDGTGATYTIDNFSSVCEPADPADLCPADVNADGTVDVQDLVDLLLAWGTADPEADVTGDGLVDVQDLVALIVAWGACPLVNDACGDAAVVGNGSTGFNTAGATLDQGVPAFTCGAGVNDVWFNYIASCTGSVTIDTGGSDFDTLVEAYQGHACPPGLSLGCDDDGGPGATSSLTLPVTQGDQLKIRVGGKAPSPQGPGTITIACMPPGPPPNDPCAGAIQLTLVGGVAEATGQTLTATVSPEARACDGICPMSRDVWYRVQGTGHLMTAGLCGPATDFDAVMVVYCGPDCSSLGCAAADADGCGEPGQIGVPPEVMWCSTLGQTYWINVQGFLSSDFGQFELIVVDGPTCPQPVACQPLPQSLPNDECPDAIPVTGDQELEISTTGACTDGVAHAACQYDGQTHQDVWFLYTADCAGVVEISTCNQSMFDTDVAVYDGSGWPASCPPGDADLIACADDTVPLCEDFGAFIVIEDVVAGQQLLIRVGGHDEGNQGVTTLSIRCFVPDNDFCALAEPIGPAGNPQEAPDTIEASTCGATAQFLPQCGGGVVKSAPGRWYSTVGDGTRYTASLCNTPGAFDTRLTVYCGPCEALDGTEDCAALEDPDNCGDGIHEELSWCTEDGREYLILVHGFFGCGDFTLSVTSDGEACGDPPCACQVSCSGQQEPEPCGGNVNSGCFGGGQGSMTPVQDAQTWCGTTWADGGMRDTDWYLLTVGAGGSVSATLTSEPPCVVYIIRDPAQNCVLGQLQIVAAGHSDSCRPATAAFNALTPGEEVYLFVSTEDIFGPIFDGLPCGQSSNYRLFVSSP